jgi:hypothetical protein
LAERAKFRGSHGGAPETGFKDSKFTILRFLRLSLPALTSVVILVVG